jgi:hypothetical protein
MIVFFVVPFERLGHDERPPKTLPFMGDPCSFFRRSLSVQISSILLSIVTKSPSAEVAEIPAR